MKKYRIIYDEILSSLENEINEWCEKEEWELFSIHFTSSLYYAVLHKKAE